VVAEVEGLPQHGGRGRRIGRRAIRMAQRHAAEAKRGNGERTDFAVLHATLPIYWCSVWGPKEARLSTTVTVAASSRVLWALFPRPTRAARISELGGHHSPCKTATTRCVRLRAPGHPDPQAGSKSCVVRSTASRARSC